MDDQRMDTDGRCGHASTDRFDSIVADGTEGNSLSSEAPGSAENLSSSFDPELILTEFQKRYEDGSRPRPRTAKLLFEENPDFAVYYSVLNIKARDFFGRTLGKELVARGILDKGAAKRAPQIVERPDQPDRLEERATKALESPGDAEDPRERFSGVKTVSRKLSVEERVKRAQADLRKYYPNGKVTRLDADHKKLGERLTKLYRGLGYSSRQDMIKSFGFEMPNEKGGRPSSVNAAEIFDELRCRYEGKSVPTSVKDLINDNPDLSAKLKTLANSLSRKSNATGTSLRKELEARGLIEIRHVQNGAVQEERVARTAQREAEAAEIRAALDDMEKRLEAFPMQDRPSTMVDLCTWFPEYEGLISAGRRRGIVSKRILRDRGLLRLSKSEIAAEQKRARLSHIRNQELPALLKHYESLSGPSFANSEHHGELLASGVLGYDLITMSELRETMFLVENIWPMSVGDAPAVEFVRCDSERYMSDLGYINVFFDANQRDTQDLIIRISSYDEFTAADRFEGDTPFKTMAGAHVVSAFMFAGCPFAVLQYRFVASLAKETVLYALRSLGVSVAIDGALLE